jgi:predicted TPR repeat methyltransferase
MGMELRPHCAQLEGIDLSRRMLAESRDKGIYDRLERAELAGFLATQAGIDVLAAADVLIYCGALPPILSAGFAALVPGGLFGFSLELHEGTGTLLQRRQLRYAHNADETLDACRLAGFEIASVERMAIRRERDLPVDGLVLLLRKPQASAASSAA